MNSESAFRLTLFGTPSLVTSDGVPITGQAVQRHRIALLALLAVRAGKGLSREKLIGYLWPERDSEQARQLLNQAVYHLRKALGEEAILSDGDDLRLNQEVLRVDVAEFEAALEGRDLDRALSLCSAPFLDGFFLTSAPELERWVEGERQRLAAAHASTLEALADVAKRKGDLPRALGLWKMRASQDPYDSRVAQRLMEALAASGNRAGALQHARIHEQLLQSEFGVTAPAEIIALAEQLKSTALPQPSTEYSPPTADRQTGGTEQAAATTEGQLARTTGPRWLVRLAAIVPVLVAIVILVSRFARPSAEAVTAGTREPAIAVLPLANLSSDSRDAFLADGLTEELIGTLAKTRGLRVIASTSVFALRDRHLDVRTIAETLHVSQLLEGDVQKIGSRLRVRVRLVDARDGETRWSETYDRELRDVFAVDDDIGHAVVRELGVRIAGATSMPNEKHQTRSIAAYELYLRGNDPVLLRSDSGAQMALSYFQQAIALDSSYAAAYAGLSRLYMRGTLGGRIAKRQHEHIALAAQAATKALALDDSLADAHGALALVRASHLDLASAELHLQRAADLEPNRAIYHEWLARSYILGDRPSDALAQAQRAAELDPLSPTANAELARALLANGRPDDALAQLQKVAALRPPLLRANIIAAQCYIKKELWPQAIAVLQPQADHGGAMALAHLGFVFARTGSRADALRIRDTLSDRWGRDAGGALEVALVLDGLGDREQAFAWLDRAMSDGAVNADGAELLLDDLRRDSRFAAVRQRMGLQKR